MSEFATQQELANHFGVSQPYIAKLVRDGVLDGCKKDGRLVRECAIHAIERYRAGGRNRKPASGGTAAPPIEITPPPGLDTDENRKHLAQLLATVHDANRQVQLMRDFWAAKLNELKAGEASGELVRESEVVEAGQKAVKAMRDKLLAVPAKLAPAVVTMTEQEALEAIRAEIYDALEEVANLGKR